MSSIYNLTPLGPTENCSEHLKPSPWHRRFKIASLRLLGEVSLRIGGKFIDLGLSLGERVAKSRSAELEDLAVLLEEEQRENEHVFAQELTYQLHLRALLEGISPHSTKH